MKFIFVIVFSATFAGAQPAPPPPSQLGPAQIQNLAQDILRNTPEFQDLQRRAGSDIFVQNRTSAELIQYVRENVERRGVGAFSQDVRSGRVRLSDWHSLNAPLDISAAPASAARLERASITSTYRGVSVNERLPMTNGIYEVQIGAAATRNAEELAKSVSGTTTLRFTEDVLAAKNPTATLRAYAETVEFLADNPQVKLSGESQTQVNRLFETVKSQPGKFAPILRDGNTYAGAARTEPEAIVSILERAQLSSRSRIPAGAGLDTVLSGAGGLVSDYRLQETARFSTSRSLSGGGIRVLHGTSELGAQSIQRGQLAFSNGLNVIDGQMSGVAEGNGIYTVGPGSEPPFSNRIVEIELDPDCVAQKTCAYDKARNWYRITKQEAIRAARVVPQDEYFERLVTAAREAPEAKRLRLLETAANLLSPENNVADAAKFTQLRAQARAIGGENQLLANYLSKPGTVESVLSRPGTNPLKTDVINFIAAQPNTGPDAGPILRNLVTADPDIIKQYPDLQARAQRYVTDIGAGTVTIDIGDRELADSLRRVSPQALDLATMRSVGSFDYNPSSQSDLRLLERLSDAPDADVKAFFANMRPIEDRIDEVDDLQVRKFGVNIDEIRFATLARQNPELALKLALRGLSLPNAKDRPIGGIVSQINSDRISTQSRQRLLALVGQDSASAARTAAVSILRGSNNAEVVSGLKAAFLKSPGRTDLLVAVSDNLTSSELVQLAKKNQAATGRFDDGVLNQLIERKSDPTVARFLETQAQGNTSILARIGGISSAGVDGFIARLNDAGTSAADRANILRQLEGKVSEEKFTSLLADELRKPASNRIPIAGFLPETRQLSGDLKQLILRTLNESSETDRFNILKALKGKLSPEEFKAAVISNLNAGEINNYQRNFLVEAGLDKDPDILDNIKRRVASLDRVRVESVVGLLPPSPELTRAVIAATEGNVNDNLVKYLASDSEFGGQRRLAELARAARPGTYQAQILSNAVADVARAPGGRGVAAAAGAGARSGFMKCVLNSLLGRR